MVMRLLPQVAQDPQRSPAGQVQGGVVPVRDVTGSQIADAGEGLVRLGQSVTSAADLYQDQLDLAMQAQSENRLRDVLREELESPESGYLNTVGMDAVGERRKKAFDRLTAERGKIEAGLKNEAQKAGFREQADRMLSTATTLADRHQQEQVKVFRVGELQARSANSFDEAMKLAGTDAGEVAKLSALRDVDDLGGLLGWGPQQVDALKMQQTTKLHEGVVRNLIRSGAPGSADVAGSYLAKNLGEVAGSRHDELTSLVRTARNSDQAARLADKAWEVGMTVQDAENAGQKLYEGGQISLAVRDEAIDRLRSRVINQQNDKDRLRSNTLKSAEQFAQLNRATVNSYSMLPPEVRESLRQSGGEDAMKLFFERGGQRITTAAGANFMADIAANPGVLRRFQTVDAMQAALFNDLDPDDALKASALWGKAHEQGEPSDTMDDGQVTTHIYLKMRDARIIPDAGANIGKAQEQANADKQKRMQLAVEMEAKKIGGKDWRSASVLNKAWETVAGPEIRNAAGQTVPMATLSKPELDAEGVGYETEFGFVRGGALNQDVTASMLRLIEAENAALPAGSPARQGTRQQDIARRYKMELDRQDAERSSVIRANWDSPSGGWWNSRFGYSRARYESARSAAEKRIMQELDKRGVPYQVDDILARM